jgi:type II secretory pathway pseudopilin PulG
MNNQKKLNRYNMPNLKQKRQKLSKEASFTFIELLAAIIVLSIGLLSVIAISSKSYAAVSLQKNKLIAVNLAKEGVELVRFARNKNWKEEDSGQKRTVNGGNCDTGNGAPYDWRCLDPQNAVLNPIPETLSEDLSDISMAAGLNPGNEDWHWFGWVYCSQTVWADDCCTALSPNERGCRLHIMTEPLETPVGDLDDVVGFYVHKWIGEDLLGINKKETPFHRRIKIDNYVDYSLIDGFTVESISSAYENLDGDSTPENDFQVKVTVSWQERNGQWYEVTVEDHLYNWYQPE